MAQAPAQGSLRSGYSVAVQEYTARAASLRGIIEPEARLLSTPRVRNVYLGRHAQVNGATLVEDSTLLSSEREPTTVTSGACVRSSLLQWGSSVDTMAVVERSLLTEHSHVERHGKVTDSEGKPMTGATISIDRQGISQHFEVKTDNKGQFLHAGLPTGTYKVSVLKDGKPLMTNDARVNFGGD